MSTTKHTPGPWVNMGHSGHKDGPEGELHCIQTDSRTGLVAWVCNVPVMVPTPEARERAAANAALIAAAPELLEAAKLAEAVLVNHINMDPKMYRKYRDAWEPLVAAIAKAEGR